MSPGVRLLPVAAAESASRLDHLALAVLLLTGAVALGVLVLLIWFSIKYRASSNADRSHVPARKRWVEVTWILIPLLLFLGMYVWGAVDYVQLYQSPRDATPVFVVAKQWMWKAQHTNGRREVGELHLPLGRPVRMIMTSEDVIHSFFVPDFRIKQDVVPGRYTSIAFTPSVAGEYRLFCAEYCGLDHAVMGGKVIVMRQAEYARWLSEGPRQPGMAARGFELYRRYGCSGCHEAGSSVHAPDLDGLYGRVVHLSDGSSVVADNRYIRDSILQPDRQVVAGYAPIMPSFSGQLSEEELIELVAYLKSTQPGPGTRDSGLGQAPAAGSSTQ
jgi:cytochrome c oxidase subunit 2